MSYGRIAFLIFGLMVYSPQTLGVAPNTDGTRPSIVFAPSSLIGTFTLSQITQSGAKYNLMRLTFDPNNRMMPFQVQTLSESGLDDRLARPDGYWQFQRDLNVPQNPKGTKLQPGFFSLELYQNERLFKKFTFPYVIQDPRVQPQYRTTAVTDRIPTRTPDGKILKSLLINLDANTVTSGYGMPDKDPAPTIPVYVFDRATHHYLDNPRLLRQTLETLQAAPYLSHIKTPPDPKQDPNTLTFNFTLQIRGDFFVSLSRTYLMNLFQQSAAPYRNTFINMKETDLQALAKSLVGWLESQTFGQSNQRLLKPIEKQTFFPSILEGVRQAKNTLKPGPVPQKNQQF